MNRRAAIGMVNEISLVAGSFSLRLSCITRSHGQVFARRSSLTLILGIVIRLHQMSIPSTRHISRMLLHSPEIASLAH